MFPARSKITVRVVMGVISVLAASAQAATITWNGDGDGTSWHDANNWDLNQVPVAGDDVIIPDVASTAVVVFSAGTTAINSLDCDEPFQLSGGTLDIAATTAFNNTYTQTAGKLTGTSNVIVNGLTTWDGGEIDGSAGTETFTVNGWMKLGSGAQKLLDNRTLDLSGKAIPLSSSGGATVTTIDGTGLGDSVVKCIGGEARFRRRNSIPGSNQSLDTREQA